LKHQIKHDIFKFVILNNTSYGKSTWVLTFL